MQKINGECDVHKEPVQCSIVLEFGIFDARLGFGGNIPKVGHGHLALCGTHYLEFLENHACKVVPTEPSLLLNITVNNFKDGYMEEEVGAMRLYLTESEFKDFVKWANDAYISDFNGNSGENFTLPEDPNDTIEHFNSRTFYDGSLGV